MADYASPVPGVRPSFAGNNQGGFTNDSDARSRRVRLRPKPDGAIQIYGSNGILQPLRSTNGLVWPYQPAIEYTQTVDYQAIDLVHVNQEIMSYTKTPAPKFGVSGQFSVQNQQEGAYALAAIHFMRTVTKMYFGSSDPNAGTPPPVLLFDAYGQYMFNQLPVIVTQFKHELPADVDYVPIDLNNIQVLSQSQANTNIPGNSRLQRTPQISSYDNVANSALMTARMFRSDLGSDNYIWLPSVFTLSCELTVQNTATRLKAFNLDSFRTGELMKQGRWI